MSNPPSHKSLLAPFCALAFFFVFASAIHEQETPRKSNPSRLNSEIRQELLRVREAVWRLWFTNNSKQLEKLLPQDLSDVAILYSIYSFEVQEGDSRTVQSGRATEIFVRHHGRWENLGWHLDSGKERCFRP